MKRFKTRFNEFISQDDYEWMPAFEKMTAIEELLTDFKE